MKTKEIVVTLRVTTTEEVDIDGHVARSIVEDLRDGHQNDFIDYVEVCNWGCKEFDTTEMKDYLTKFIAQWNDTPWQLHEPLVRQYQTWCGTHGLNSELSAEYHLMNLGG